MMGRWEVERQRELFVATDRAAKAPRHVFYEKPNSLLREAGFDRWVEGLCEEFYSERGRGSIPPGRYFRMLFIGYFEGMDSQRGIAWWCDDSLSSKVFLGLEPLDEAPDHSRLTKIGDRLPTEVHREVFQFVLRMVQKRGLLKGQTVGVDSTLLEANAAMKSIVRKDRGDDRRHAELGRRPSGRGHARRITDRRGGRRQGRPQSRDAGSSDGSLQLAPPHGTLCLGNEPGPANRHRRTGREAQPSLDRQASRMGSRVSRQPPPHSGLTRQIVTTPP